MGCNWDGGGLGPNFVLIGLLLMAVFTGVAAAQVPGTAFTIDTYAGSDPLRNGGPATDGLLWNPTGVAVDGNGNLYIVDQSDNLVRRVAANGVISTFAGTGRTGIGQNGIPATESDIYKPEGVAVDAAGNVYFTNGRNRVRKVTLDGTVSTYAGSGSYGYTGDGGPAVDASFRAPKGLAVDSNGNVYVADYSNHCIRRIGVDGTVTTVAGTGEQGFSGDGDQATAAQLKYPEDVAVDGAGNVYIADTSNSRIRKIAPDGVITTVAGNGSSGIPTAGTATDTSLGFPYSVAAMADGTLYVGGSAYVVRIDTNGMLTPVVLGSGFVGDGGPASDAGVDIIYGIAVAADGTVYLADSGHNRVRAISPGGTIDTVAGTSHLIGNSGPADQAVLFAPAGADIDAAGNLYVAESENRVVRKIDANGIVSTFAGTGVDSNTGDGALATAASFRSPSDVAVGPQGDIFVADAGAYRVRKISSDGMISAYAGSGAMATPATMVRRLRRSCATSLASPWTRTATSISRTPIRTSSAASIPAGRSRPWPGRASRDSRATVARQWKRSSSPRRTSSPTRTATSTLPIPEIRESAASTPAVSSPRWWSTSATSLRRSSNPTAAFSSSTPMSAGFCRPGPMESPRHSASARAGLPETAARHTTPASRVRPG